MAEEGQRERRKMMQQMPVRRVEMRMRTGHPPKRWRS
jgi:hypothetical protein